MKETIDGDGSETIDKHCKERAGMTFLRRHRLPPQHVRRRLSYYIPIDGDGSETIDKHGLLYCARLEGQTFEHARLIRGGG